MRIEINILTPTEAYIYVDTGDPYKLTSSAGYYWKLFDASMNELRRWKNKDGQTVKDALPEALRIVFLQK